METVTIASLMTTVTTGVKGIIGMFGDVLDLFVTNPILLLALCVSMAGVAIGLVRKLIKR